MTGSLADYQAMFIASLSDPGARSPMAAQPAFAVYRNTVTSGCVDALRANFPSVLRLVGDAWFADAATAYVHAHLPRDGRLLMYGDTFPAFLATFAPAPELRYLAPVARLDRFWIESHTAADAHAVDARWLARLSPADLGTVRLAPHPATRWCHIDDLPVYSIWAPNRLGIAPPDELVWQGEGALLCRPLDEVTWQPLCAGGCAFLDACAAGHDRAQAADAALARAPAADLAALLSTLITAGALTGPPAHEGALR
jgi:hypothetical protein